MQHEIMTDRVVNDPLVIVLLEFVAKSDDKFEDTVGKLHQQIEELHPYNKRLPATAAHLSNNLQRLIPVMKEIGLMVEMGHKTRKGRMVRIWLEADLAETETDYDL